MARQQDQAPALTREFFGREPVSVAPALLGAVLEHEVDGVRVGVRLTEVEAYLGEGEDPASHSFRGRRPRNAVMFGPPGHAYVYFTYGMHWCANIVCREDGVSGGVLLRAGEVVTGLEAARARRPTARKDAELARGPARLARAMGITGADNGRDVVSDPGLRVRPGPPVARSRIRTGPRVGVAAGAGSAFRFWVDGDPTVSVYRPAKPRARRPQSGRGS